MSIFMEKAEAVPRLAVPPGDQLQKVARRLGITN
jgi:hypothetical protein